MQSVSSEKLRQQWHRLGKIARTGSEFVGARLDERRLPHGFTPDREDRFVAAAYFGSSVHSAYQLEQWLWPFEQLRDSLVEQGEGSAPLGILVRDAQAAQRIARLTDLPVRFSRLTSGLDAFFSSPHLRMVFYVNQATLNFQALRFPAPAHVHLSHGESEKISMISNQLKAYDFVFTAGQAARNRITGTLHGVDPKALIDVGRPQLDRPAEPPSEWQDFTTTAPGGPVVLFAPTWEGDSPSMSYGTMNQTGVGLVTQLLDAGYRVIVRTHPRTGLIRGDFAKALAEVRDTVEAHPRGFLDTSADVSWQLDVADIAFAEMSSVAFDWLATRKPLVMIAPTDPRAEVLSGGLLDLAATWTPDSRRTVDSLISEAAAVDAVELSRRYLGDTQPGIQLARFISAANTVLGSRGSKIADTL